MDLQDSSFRIPPKELPVWETYLRIHTIGGFLVTYIRD